jgi:cytidyltransferase-like protein
MARKNTKNTMRAGSKKIVVAVSGGFDPIHPGHIRMFREAKKLGDELVVILNNDNWLRAKKLHIFMSERERQEVIAALKDVDRVVLTRHGENPMDMSVCAELASLKPDIFANGGDRSRADAARKESSLNPEQQLCTDLGITMVFGTGEGGKIQSSSLLLKNYVEAVTGQGKTVGGTV